MVDARSLRVGCTEEGGEKGSYCLMRTEFQFEKMKVFWRWLAGGDGFTIMGT